MSSGNSKLAVTRAGTACLDTNSIEPTMELLQDVLETDMASQRRGFCNCPYATLPLYIYTARLGNWDPESLKVFLRLLLFMMVVSFSPFLRYDLGRS